MTAIVRAALAVASCAAAAAPSSGTAAGAPLSPVARAELIVTSGRIDPTAEGLALRAPTIRATVGRAPRRAIEAAFVYRGPSDETAPLASGELRRQIGLKLRARDGCNVVYVMWHVAPTSGIHVAVKSNPAARTDAACGDRGYTNLVPTWARAGVRAIAVGERRTLTAALIGDELRVDVDGAPAWRGTVPPSADAFDGPVGVRSDNGVFDLSLRAGPPVTATEARP